MIKTKVIKSPLNHDLMDVKGGDRLGDKNVVFFFRKRSKLGKLNLLRKIKKVPIPKGFFVTTIQNHKPSVGKVTIKFKK